LRDHGARHGGLAIASPIDIVFSQYDVLQPDVVFFTAARRHLVDLDSAIRHAPDLCVEVLSPSTEDRDRGRKMQILPRYGVPEYWIVDPRAESLEVYQRVSSGYALIATVSGDEPFTSPTVEGLAFRPAQIFQIP